MAMGTDDIRSVFICSCQANEDETSCIHNLLKKSSPSFLVSESLDFPPGEIIPLALREAVRKNKRMILIVSNEWKSDLWSRCQLFWTEMHARCRELHSCVIVNLTPDRNFMSEHVKLLACRENVIPFERNEDFCKKLLKMLEEPIQKRHCDIAHGFAWTYFFGYFKIVSEDFVKNFDLNVGETKDTQRVTKIFIPVPLNAKVETSYKCLERKDPISKEVDRACNQKRKFQINIYECSEPSGKEVPEKRKCFALDIPSIVQNLADMKDMLSDEEVERETQGFVKILNNIFHYYKIDAEAFLFTNDESLHNELISKCKEKENVESPVPRATEENVVGYVCCHEDDDENRDKIIEELEKRKIKFIVPKIGGTEIGNFDRCISESDVVIFLLSAKITKQSQTFLFNQYAHQEMKKRKSDRKPRLGIKVLMDDFADSDHLQESTQIVTHRWDSGSQVFFDKLVKSILCPPLPYESTIPAGEIGLPMATAHFHGYLHLVHKGGLMEKFHSWCKMQKTTNLAIPFMLEVIPMSCAPEAKLRNYNPEHIKYVHSITIECMSAGQIRKDYKVWICEISSPSHPEQESFFLVS